MIGYSVSPSPQPFHNQHAFGSMSLMKQSKIMLCLALLLSTLLVLTACVGPTSSTSVVATTAGTTAAATTQATTEKTFTVAELATFTGQNGNPAYIAVDGVVYDVTKVAVWGSRLHNGVFQAGKDYSAEIKKAPHGVDKLLTAVRVGVLKP